MAPDGTRAISWSWATWRIFIKEERFPLALSASHRRGDSFLQAKTAVSPADPAERSVRIPADIDRFPPSFRRGTGRTRTTGGCGPGTRRGYSGDRGGSPTLRILSAT